MEDPELNEVSESDDVEETDGEAGIDELRAEVLDLSEQLDAAHELVEEASQHRRVLATALAAHKRSQLPPAEQTQVIESLHLINDAFLNSLTAVYRGEPEDLLGFLLDISEALGQAIGAAREIQRLQLELGEISDDEVDDLERVAAELLVEARRIS